MNEITKLFVYFSRKETPIENAILCTSSETASPSGYESPPPSSRNLSRPPTLHRNKRHKKRIIEYSTASSDSDEGFELDRKSYNLRQNKNVMKQVDRTAEPEGRLLRKRVVKEAKVDDLKDDRSSSPMKRSKKMLDSINDITTASSSAASCPSVHCDLSKPYSELNYFESIGSIRTIRRAKHPNINKVPSSKVITATPLISPESQNGWDRKTKLKISYRTGLVKKDDVQFALIIYEPLTVVTRRNLLEEFQKAAEEEEEQQKDKKPSKTLFSTPLNSTKGSRDSVSLKTPLIRAKPKNEKSSSLRRLRF